MQTTILTDDCYCQNCGRLLKKGRKVALLVLSTRTGLWYENEDAFEDDESQGAFEFGLRCAKRVINNSGLDIGGNII